MKIGKELIWIINNLAIILTLTIFYSCKKNDTPEEASKRFCDCMKENGSPKNYDYAFKTCNKEFIRTNKIYRLFKVDLAHHSMDELKMSYNAVDSVYKYMTIFNNYGMEHCCDVVLKCYEDSVMHSAPDGVSR